MNASPTLSQGAVRRSGALRRGRPREARSPIGACLRANALPVALALFCVAAQPIVDYVGGVPVHVSVGDAAMLSVLVAAAANRRTTWSVLRGMSPLLIVAIALLVLGTCTGILGALGSLRALLNPVKEAWLGMVLAVVVTALASRSERMARSYSLVVVAALLALPIGWFLPGGWYGERYVGALQDPNATGHFYGWAALAALQASSAVPWPLASAAIGASAFAVWKSGSVGTRLSLLVGLAVGAVATLVPRPTRRALPHLFLAGAFAIGILWLSGAFTIKSVLEQVPGLAAVDPMGMGRVSTGAGTEQGRLRGFRLAVDTIATRPFGRSDGKLGGVAREDPGEAHNDFFQIWVEKGAFGAVGYLVLWLAMAQTVSRLMMRPGTSRLTQAALLAQLVFMFAQTFSLETFHFRTFWAWMALLTAEVMTDPPPSPSRAPAAPRAARRPADAVQA